MGHCTHSLPACCQSCRPVIQGGISAPKNSNSVEILLQCGWKVQELKKLIILSAFGVDWTAILMRYWHHTGISIWITRRRKLLFIHLFFAPIWDWRWWWEMMASKLAISQTSESKKIQHADVCFKSTNVKCVPSFLTCRISKDTVCKDHLTVVSIFCCAVISKHTGGMSKSLHISSELLNNGLVLSAWDVSNWRPRLHQNLCMSPWRDILNEPAAKFILSSSFILTTSTKITWLEVLQSKCSL